MNILVTGGCGFIGKNLVTELQRGGHTIITVDMKGNPTYTCDISKQDLSELITEDIDIIYHLAAQPFGKGSELQPYTDLEYNVRGTLNTCYLAKSKNVKHIIYTSTTAVYGDNEFANEESPLNPLSNYAVTKLTGEYYVKKFSQDVGFKYTILRLWNTYGPGQDLSNESKGVVFAFANQIIKNQKVIKSTGSLTRYRDIIYVDDVVNALIHSMNLSKSDTFNVSTGVSTTIEELITTLILANGHNVSDYQIVDIGTHTGDQFGCIGDNNKLKQTGWSPTVSLSHGTKLFLDYLKENSQ